ncbi:MAG: aldehyde dehydrogenase family protein, partial [Myxococcales bacterium]|nr:aldehyde dehydrogenase family protein [Myxococcales bacterium]
MWNMTELRPLEGFTFALTPFNFTAIAGNLPSAPALMGNTVLWKPAEVQMLAAYYTMLLFEEAGLPPGVINFLPGMGHEIAPVALAHRDLDAVHFTGSTEVFRSMWKQVAGNLEHYKGYPRLVGETGGKDF